MMYKCPCCQQPSVRAKIDIQSVAQAIEKDKLTDKDLFKRTYIGHGLQSSVFVFQGHKGPFKKHVHVTHDEIGYVLKGAGKVMVGDLTREVREGDVWIIPANTPHAGAFETEPTLVLFVSSPVDDPENPDRIWLE